MSSVLSGEPGPRPYDNGRKVLQIGQQIGYRKGIVLQDVDGTSGNRLSK